MYLSNVIVLGFIAVASSVKNEVINYEANQSARYLLFVCGLYTNNSNKSVEDFPQKIYEKSW